MKKILVLFLCLLCLQATQAFDQQKAFEKLYRTLSMYGDDPYGIPDIPVMDGGTVDLVRQLTNLNELTTDVVYTFWEDPGLPELALSKPESDNPFVLGLYRRLEYNILKCNEFLDNTSDDDDESRVQRAEARFLRAYFYSIAIDLWGDMPLWKTASDNPATRSSRKVVFDFITQELKSCAEGMATPAASQYGRADRVAVWLLLARLYLNAEVYTGTPQWQQAKDYAQLVIDSDYSLCDHYAYLFMGDNDSNGAQSEIILPAVVDGLTQFSYGCTMYLIAATHSDDMPPYGLNHSWSGFCARKDLLDKFFPADNAPRTSTAEMVSAAHDDRCLLYGINRKPGNQLTDSFYDCYSIDKFTNNCAYGVASSVNFPDTDFPLMRMAEAYLVFAEADARLNGGACSSDGLDQLNALRHRAHATILSHASLDDLADEWCREFYLEGRRRTDLIRFGLYSGDSYLWTGKGNLQNPEALPPYRTLMPMPEDVLIEHPQYTQNLGYDDPNFVPEGLTLNTPAFGEDIVSLQNVEALRLSWQKPLNLTEGRKLNIALELSLNPEFNNPKTVLTVSDGAYELWVDARELNHFLLETDSKAYEYTSVTVYARCATRTAVSNTVELNIKAYDNFGEQMAQPWYFVGSGISSKAWTNSINDIGPGLFPMNIGADGNSVYTGYFHAGDTFVIVEKPERWDGVVWSYDGSPYSLSIMDRGENINIYEDGWYTFRVFPQWRSATCQKIDSQEWPLYWRMMMASGFRGSKVTAMEPCDPANDNNHLWYVRAVFDTDDGVWFLPNGKGSAQVGGEQFPYGNASEGAKAIPVAAGDYVVVYDDLTNHYQFIDAATGQLPEVFERGHRVVEVTPVELIHLTEVDTETLKVCDVAFPSALETETLRLIVGQREFAMNAQGEVDAAEFISAMIDMFGQYGRYVVEAQVVFSAMESDLLYPFASEPFSLNIQLLSLPFEQQYYYVGSQTNWNFGDLSMRMTCLGGNAYIVDPRFQIDITLAAGQEDRFNIFPTSAMTSDNPWPYAVRPLDSGTETSGRIGIGDVGNTWYLAAPTQETTYRLTLDFVKGTYTIADLSAVPTSLPPLHGDGVSLRRTVYDQQGLPTTGQKKGINIINHKKIIR